jgi:hypothetical protein
MPARVKQRLNRYVEKLISSVRSAADSNKGFGRNRSGSLGKKSGRTDSKYFPSYGYKTSQRKLPELENGKN